MPFAPPPPPPPGPPPPPSFPAAAPTATSDPNQRNQLLQSIRKGTNLKKTVTNDRSAPVVGGKSGGTPGGSGPPSLGSPGSGGSPKSGSATLGRNNALAGLFAGGMPKLKPTGLDIGQSNSSQSQSLTSLPVANASSLHTKMENSRRQLSIDVKNRGPPPQPPPANQKPTMPQSASDSVLTGQSAVGARSHSTTSLNQPPQTTNGWSSTQLPRKAPAGGYGKPHVAPKPPGSNGRGSGAGVGGAGGVSKPCPPPKRPVGMVARAHSMRAPKSPPIAPLPNAPAFPSPSSPASRVGAPPTELNRIGAPPPFHQSQDSLMQTPPPPPSLRGAGPPQSGRSLAIGAGGATRPMQRPPPPPPSRLGQSPQAGAPPPPPPPPMQAPPPPPHRVPSDSSLMSNGGQPPPPPTRNSSIRNGMPSICADLEARFADMFHHPSELPPPPPFRNLPKSYNSKSVSSKQQAPQPPTHIQLGNRMWARDNTSTC
ncbi:WAS/WASL-interacting protein family member 2 [Nilaparvata lugens]|uniref:WAS/WASL-interacting protein family member 2 n=1 Tax=Nilaparvata lugens TaxID=108931 RepID=UPI00193D07D7|nr:WAS/WASL-interacting protein family member 2 [Nilaparvata lugens]